MQACNGQILTFCIAFYNIYFLTRITWNMQRIAVCVFFDAPIEYSFYPYDQVSQCTLKQRSCCANKSLYVRLLCHILPFVYWALYVCSFESSINNVSLIPIFRRRGALAQLLVVSQSSNCVIVVIAFVVVVLLMNFQHNNIEVVVHSLDSVSTL